ncbi:MAG: hypothetical protein RL654_103 [Pseudomonadota bacterium]|jgi:hypothetical protein
MNTMNSNHGLMQRILNNRRSRVELQPGVFAVVQRPAEGEMPSYFAALEGGGDISAVMRWVVGWEGVTEGMLLGDGSSSPVPWSDAVAKAIFADKIDWVRAVTAELSRLITLHMERRASALGKPSASSTALSTESGPTTTDPSPDLPTT